VHITSKPTIDLITGTTQPGVSYGYNRLTGTTRFGLTYGYDLRVQFDQLTGTTHGCKVQVQVPTINLITDTTQSGVTYGYNRLTGTSYGCGSINLRVQLTGRP